MGWQRIAPHLLRPEARQERLVWYWDDGPLAAGELLLWLDEANRGGRFQLSHAAFPDRREYLADWHAGGELRFGRIAAGDNGAHRKMAPIIRYQQPDPRQLARLSSYFARNAAALDPAHRAAIATILGAPAAPQPPRPPASRLPGAVNAVSGKNGGQGAGTAATSKGARR